MNARLSLPLVALLLVGAALALWFSDQEPGAPAAGPISVQAAPPSQPFTLAISWHPAFCESKPRLSECRNERASDFAATNLTLHGLWPVDNYCGVSDALVALDTDNRWDRLPEPELSRGLRARLAKAMPGVDGNLHRHEWLFHGTCTGTSSERYFTRALALLDEINASAVGDLLARNVGRQVTRDAIRRAFDTAFGSGAGRTVRVDCEPDGNRTLISELRINLDGDVMGTASLADLIRAARNAGAGCSAGTLDRVGNQ